MSRPGHPFLPQFPRRLQNPEPATPAPSPDVELILHATYALSRGVPRSLVIQTLVTDGIELRTAQRVVRDAETLARRANPVAKTWRKFAGQR